MEYAIGILFIVVMIQFVLQLIFYRNTAKELKDLRAKLPKESAVKREERILKLYSNLEELMEAFEDYVDETRAELERIRKETAVRATAASRIKGKLAEHIREPQKDTEYRAQMHLPLPDMNGEEGVVLELGGMSPQQAPVRAVSPLADTGVSDPVRPEREEKPLPSFAEELRVEVSHSDEEETMEEFSPPVAGEDGRTTVIRPLPPATEGTREPGHISPEDIQASGRFATKPQRIRFLSSKGYHPDDIARELGIGKGEVAVVLRIDA